jgi:tryptophanyl-tRNA synthetase
MATQRVLTGITTTGTPHLGNYAGAIRPAIVASLQPHVESFFFLADYHALIKCDDPQRIARSRLEIAATWLAAGLDPERVTFYRQSDIPEIPELAWLLTCLTAKGQMNRAHAYKAAVDANLAAGEDTEAGITMGLYCYPILMAADILMFKAERIPVGRDQVQHIEMARDIAQRFNHQYSPETPLFVLPEAEVEKTLALLPGLDGRKMSKSYDNTIPLFEGGAKALKDAVARIVTDSRLPGESKDSQTSHLAAIHDAFATADQRAQFHADLQNGLGWGEAKQQLTQRLDEQLAPMRDRYESLIRRPDDIEDLLRQGAHKARQIATPFMQTLRETVGLSATRSTSSLPKTSKEKKAFFKQYRQADGLFYFKLNAFDDQVLLQSKGFSEARDAGNWVKRLKVEGVDALEQALQKAVVVLPDEGPQAIAQLQTALKAMRENAGT